MKGLFTVMEKKEYNEEIEIDLGEVFHMLLSKIGLIVMVGVIFAAASICVSKFFITPQYESQTRLYVLSRQDQGQLTSGDMQASSLITKDYAELIKSRTVMNSVIKKEKIDLTPEAMLKKIQVETKDDTRVVTIKVIDEDPYLAKDMANDVRHAAAEHIETVMDCDAVNVVDKANFPRKPCSPNVKKNGLVAGVLGILLTILVLLIRFITNDSIKTSEDVEKYLGVSTLGVIPEENRKKSRKSKH